MIAHPLSSEKSAKESRSGRGQTDFSFKKLEDRKDQDSRPGRLLEKRSLITFSIIGLVIRFALAPFLGHPYDMRVFMAVGWAVAHGITPYGQYVLQDIFKAMPHPHLWGTFYGIGYPPMWGLVLGAMDLVSSMLTPDNIYSLVLSLKIPIILSDLATALVIYRILKVKLNERTAFKAFCFYQLCPFLIVIGAVWGMFDILVSLLAIISAYLLLERRGLSMISLALACSLKPYTIIMIPLYSIFIHKKTHSLKESLSYLFGATGLLTIISIIPLVVFNWSLSNLFYALFWQLSPTIDDATASYGAASPFNIFNVLRSVDPAIKPSWILYNVWIVASVVLCFYAIRRISNVTFTSIINWSFLASLVFFTTRHWVSEQNLVLILSYFLLVTLLNGVRSSWKYIHVLWILFFAFVMLNVPVISFLWIIYPWTVNAASAFCDSPLGSIRWGLLSGLTFSWLGILWSYTTRRMSWR